MSEYYEPTIPDQDLQAEENRLVRKALTSLPEPYLSGLKLNADIEINGLTLNTIDANNVVWVVSDIDGWWNLPDSELPDLPRGWGDGSYDAIGRFSARVLTLTGSFLTQDPSQVPAAREKLLNAVNLVKTGGWLIVDEGPKKASYVRLSGAPQISSTRARGRHDFSIGLIANDPIKYEYVDDGPDGYSITTITANSSGEGTANLINNGNTSVPVIIELSKGFTVANPNALPTITNTENDQVIRIIEGTASDKRLEVDTYNREVISVQYNYTNISNAVANGTAVTYTTGSAHGILEGDIVSVEGITPSSLDVLQATVISANTLSFTVASAATGTYVSGGQSEAYVGVENARSSLPVLVDWMYLEPGTNALTIANFPVGSTCRIYYRSGWIG